MLPVVKASEKSLLIHRTSCQSTSDANGQSLHDKCTCPEKHG